VSALTSVFESVGDYHAIARVSEERPPPSHAINRGILAEGMEKKRFKNRLKFEIFRHGVFYFWLAWSRSWYDNTY
jgi:hypothetical protein